MNREHQKHAIFIWQGSSTLLLSWLRHIEYLICLALCHHLAHRDLDLIITKFYHADSTSSFPRSLGKAL